MVVPLPRFVSPVVVGTIAVGDACGRTSFDEIGENGAGGHDMASGGVGARAEAGTATEPPDSSGGNVSSAGGASGSSAGPLCDERAAARRRGRRRQRLRVRSSRQLGRQPSFRPGPNFLCVIFARVLGLVVAQERNTHAKAVRVFRWRR